MNKIVLKNVRPFVNGKFESPTTMNLADGKWVKEDLTDATVFDAGGALALPALFGLGLDFKEPLRDDIYDFKDGVDAMRRGGFYGGLYESSDNAIDDSRKLSAIKQISSFAGFAFSFLGAFSVGYKCKELTEMIELAEEGAVGFGDGNQDATRTRFLRLAMEYGSMTGKRFFFMPLDESLRHHGLVHEGHYADTLGMKGIPRVAETIAAFRILEMARFLKVPVHFKQVSCGETLKLIENAREQGVEVLRQDKEVNFEDAVPGAISLEIALPALWKPLVEKLGEARALELLSFAPAKIAGADSSDLSLGSKANLVLFNDKEETVVAPSLFAGQVRNCPLLGQTLSGKIKGSYLGGLWTEV